MKSKFILTGIAALLTSVAGANALEFRPFVGATMGLQGVFYSDDAKDLERADHIDLPTSLFTFGIEGVSRSLLAQITRHRMASFSVKSQRYVREGSFEYVIPPEIAAEPEALEMYKEIMDLILPSWDDFAPIMSTLYPWSVLPAMLS